MGTSKTQAPIIHANYSMMKYVSLIALGVSFFILITDFVIQNVWWEENMFLYKILDIIFTIVSLAAVSFFWFFKIKKTEVQNIGSIIFPFIYLIWSAIVNGIDFHILGLSTFLIVLLLCTFFLYIKLITSLLFYLSSSIVLLTTIYLKSGIDDNFVPVIFIFVPIISFSVLITGRNYKNKLKELAQIEKIAEMNKILLDSNENLEAEVEKRTGEIQLALLRAEESDRLKSAFLANMSHEIRTPMNGILGFTELLKEPDLTGEKQMDYIKIIEKSGVRMLNTINSIIEISKIESGMIEVDNREWNINEQTEFIYSFFKPETESKGIQLSYKNGLAFQDANIIVDREKLIGILTNLVKNSIKYTDKGEIEFGYNYGIDNRHDSSRQNALSVLTFYVKDTGIGIPHDRQEAVFERFIQADIGDKRAFQGFGLGLAITRTYVEILGGEMWLESEVGKGTIFYFTIPYKVGSRKKNVLIEKGDKKIKKLKILIVEDDEISDLFFTESLRNISSELMHAKTGTEAIEICKSRNDIDLILMDIRIPDINGYEATRQIRQFNKNVIIIAQTAFGFSTDRDKALDAGCNDYISKPIEKELLIQLIEQHF